jgi:hypothetical protein
VNSNLTNFNDLIVNGSSVTNLNLAINKIPEVDDRISIAQVNPTGTNRTPVHNVVASGGNPIWTAVDLETTVITQINIISFPTNATSFTVGNITYYPHADSIPAECPTTTCLVFPATGGVNVPTDAAGVPLNLAVDPSFPGAGSVVFTYTATDAAGAVSAPGTATIPFTISGGGALSVKIEKFEVYQQECTMKLTWILNSDITVKQVEVQKSSNGISFVPLTTFNKKQGSYFDKTEQKQLFYRLKITENDGLVTYSAIKKLNSNCADDFSVTLMGNPVNNTFGLKIYSATQQVVEYVIEDITGRLFRRKSLALTSGTITINESLTHLAKGVYYFKVITPGKPLSVIKFIKL